MFLGFATTPTTCAAATPGARKLRVPDFGTSITEGVRTLNSGATADTNGNDSSLGWASDLREKLGAEVGDMGFGGSGITKPSGSGGVPPLKTSLGLLWGGGSARRFSSAVPDAIVIEEGTNDIAYDITADCIIALNLLLAAMPKRVPIVVLRPFNGATKKAQILAAIAGCSATHRVFLRRHCGVVGDSK
jgi:lysophospholipase L1-like esterase